jgi:flagellar hook protein FlgE
MIDFSAPLLGMTQAESSVNQVASRLAQPASDTIDLSTEVVTLMQAGSDMAMNVKIAQTEDQLMQSIISILA